jgi:chitodextrinase
MRIPATVVVLGAMIGALGLAGPAAGAADVTPPTAPTNLRVTASTDSTVSLAWNPSTDGSGSWTYILIDNFGTASFHPKTQTSVVRSSLRPNTTYSYHIQAMDPSRNYSAWSNTVVHTTPPDVTPPTVAVLSLTYLAPARAAVSWTASTDNSGYPVSYTLTVDGEPRAGDIAKGRTRTLLNLAPQTPYTVVVVARDLAGNTSSSVPVVITTPARTDVTPPSAPSNLRGRTDFSQCEVYVSWDRSTDDTEPQATILYRFYVNGLLAPPSSFIIGGGTNVGASVLEAHHGGLNSFLVEAVDGSGNVSPVSNQLVLDVPADC